MNELATYTFLPWIRQGIANEINGQTGNRATIPFSVTIEGKQVEGDGNLTEIVTKDIQIYGPGDIIGLDPKAIVKAEPRNWITNFEPNYLPYIEFYNEYLPWMYSPFANPNNNRLQPWLALIVMKEDEFTNGNGKPLPYIQLTDKAQLQDPNQLHSWAHVHINRDLLGEKADGTARILKQENNQEIAKEVGKVLAENADLGYSRIICPRKLEEKTAYHAFLVPSFESGRLAGLGQDPSNVAAGLAAWGDNVANLQMPYYHRWYFRTGTVGDFEYLVRLLEPKPVDSRVGLRDMDVQKPGANLKGIIDENSTPEAEKLSGILKLGGALRVPQIFYTEEEFKQVQNYEYWAFRKDLTPEQIKVLNTNDQPVNLNQPYDFQKSLAAFVNLTDSYETTEAQIANNDSDIQQEIDATNDKEYDIKNNQDPLITAPLYGRWHALTQRLLKNKTGTDLNPNYNWVQELNLDPRWRVSAGLGTKVVQENQEDYMKAAWEQVGDVLEANKKIKEAQLAKAISEVWYEAHLQPIQIKKPEKWLSLTSPIHKKIIANGITTIGEIPKPLTVFFQKRESQITNAATSVNMRKMLRPRGKFIKRLTFDEKVRPDNLISRINAGEVSAAPPKTAPTGIQTPSDLVEIAKPKNLPDWLGNLLENNPWLKWLPLILALIILILLLLFTPAATIAGIGVAAIGALVYIYRIFDSWLKEQKNATAILEENQSPESVDDLPTSSNFRISLPNENFTPSKGDADNQEAQNFKAALRDVNFMIQETRLLGEVKERPAMNISTINAIIFEKLNPSITIPQWIGGIILLPDFIRRQLRETFTEAMAYPKIELPMYKPLAEYSAELFLPNINFIAQNSISLLETNQKFIESYMVGLNHEFARELLWREYPTDQRGSYFRQFWDVSGFLDTKPPELQDLIDRYEVVLDGRINPDLAEILNLLKAAGPKSSEFLRNARRQILKEELKDIKPLHYWSRNSKLGKHDNREELQTKLKIKKGESIDADKEEVVLVIRGELLKKYPTAVIYAHKAEWRYEMEADGETFKLDQNGDRIIDLKRERTLAPIPVGQENNPPTDIIKSPLYEAKVDPDIYFFGFDLSVCEAKGGTGDKDKPVDTRCEQEGIDRLDPGWFFIIKERDGEPRFGLDIRQGASGIDAANKIELWNDMAWEDLTPAVPEGNYIELTDDTLTILATQALEGNDEEKKEQQEDDNEVNWHKNMSSAEMAYILYQVPVLVAVHACEMLPQKPTF